MIDHGHRTYCFYTGWTLGMSVPFYLNAGLACSDDGGLTFERVSPAPLLDRSAVDPYLTASPWVIVEDGTWRMWYVSGTEWTETSEGPRHRYHIKYAESRDGLRWERTGIVCLDYRSAEEFAFGRPCVLRDGDLYRMWYSYRGAAYRIGYAESADGIVWTRRTRRASCRRPTAAGTRRWPPIPWSSGAEIASTCSTTATATAGPASALPSAPDDDPDPVQPPLHDRPGIRLHPRSHRPRHLAGDGIFSRRCEAWLEEQVGCVKALLTHSCTGALEMAALLGDIQPGDEVIMPSFTFVSTANAFVLRGGVPVFVDIRPDTLNLDERAIAAALTPRTRAIVPVHYAGVGCEMDEIVALARRHNLLVIEDAAQALGSTYKGRPAGRLGDLAATSFHETKNVTSGEGGALLINAPGLAARAEIIRDKGTNRGRFLRGEIDKYTWIDVGLVLRAERARRRLPLGADGGRGGDHRAAPGDLDLVLRGVRRRSSAEGGCGGPSSPNTAATTPTCSTRSSRMARPERGCSTF